MTYDLEGPAHRGIMMPRPKHKPGQWGRQAPRMSAKQRFRLIVQYSREAYGRLSKDELKLIYEDTFAR